MAHYYVQDPSTRIACELLDPRPGENILDACAAPGGKTGYIADLMKNEGAIVAVDQHADRLVVLRENIERLGLENVETVSHDWASDNGADANLGRGAIRPYPGGRAVHEYRCHATPGGCAMAVWPR